MKLIVGLGNPGKKYENTRHNIGFLIIDSFAKFRNLSFKEKFQGLYTEDQINNEKIILLKPQNYMNLSGSVVNKYKEYFGINIKDIFIIYDDINFELGSFKIKKTGSSGGHNGIKDIIECLKSEDIKRLKIGISKGRKELKKYVLSNFGIFEKNKVQNIIEISQNIIEEYINNDFESLMRKYNGTKK